LVNLLCAVLTPWDVELNKDISSLVIDELVKVAANQRGQEGLGSRWCRYRLGFDSRC
jgi:hypothetical protein